MSNKDAAMALVNRGLRIFPCNEKKEPLISAWEQSATSSPFAVSLKWDAAPDALPAIPVGAHGFVVIDCDRKNGIDGVGAFYTLCAEQGIDLSNAFVVETPSTGLHFYWRTETPYSNARGSLPKGIDCRGVGGYCIAPGAMLPLPDGRSYRHLSGSWDAIPALPDALAALLKRKDAPIGSELPTMPAERPAASERERQYAENALNGEIEKLTAMREGQGRNRALNEAAHSLGTMDGWIDLNRVAGELLNASIANGAMLRRMVKRRAKPIASGLQAGQEQTASTFEPSCEHRSNQCSRHDWQRHRGIQGKALPSGSATERQTFSPAHTRLRDSGAPYQLAMGSIPAPRQAHVACGRGRYR